MNIGWVEVAAIFLAIIVVSMAKDRSRTQTPTVDAPATVTSIDTASAFVRANFPDAITI